MEPSDNPSSRSPAKARLSPDERVELERRLGAPFALDGSFASLWAIELLGRTWRRVPSFRRLLGWVGPYLRALFERAYRESGLERLELGAELLGVAQPAFVHNLADSVERLFAPSTHRAPEGLSPVFRMALAPRLGLELVSLGQPSLALERARHRPQIERLVDWLVADQLRSVIGDDAERGEAGYDLVRALVAPSYGYVGSDGVDQVERVSALSQARPQERGELLRKLCASQDLYLATLAGRCCLELGIEPLHEVEARGMRRALRHFGGLPKASRSVLGAVEALLSRTESAIEGTDHPRYVEADRAAGSGAFERAYALLDALCRDAPNRAAYFCYRGYVAERLGRDAKRSCEDYDRALSLQPDYWQALINRGVLLSRTRRFADADRDLLLAHRLRPDSDDTRNNLLLNYWFRSVPLEGGGAGAAGPSGRGEGEGHREDPPQAARAAGPASPGLSDQDRLRIVQAQNAAGDRPAAAAAEGASCRKSGEGKEGTQAQQDEAEAEDWSLYEIVELLGAGGMGKVYRVRHRGWDMELALKIPRVELLEKGGVEGFVEEAEAWSRLGSHPHTVDCYYVRMRRSVPWLFAEYVDGGSLGDWIESGRLYAPSPGAPPAGSSTESVATGREPTALARMIDVALQMAYGLHHAHSHGLIHQDMKPANVILSKQGVAKVTDFGLAKVTRLADAGPASGRGSKTMVAGFMGMTPAYCSPEQAQAARARQRRTLTRRTDVWSWAVTVLEMFVGELRWMSGVLAPATLARLVDGREKPTQEHIPKVPPALADLLTRCFTTDEAKRPGDMLEIAAELRQIYQQVAPGCAARPLPSALDDVAVVLNNRAASLLDLGRPQAAESLWRQALDAEPLHPESSYNLALIEWRRGRITDEEALERVNAAVAAHRDSWRVKLLEAWVHHERAAPTEVLEACTRALDGTARTETTLSIVRRPYRGCPEGFHDERTIPLPSPPRSVAVSRDGSVAASAHDDEIRVWLVGGVGPSTRIGERADRLCLSDDGAVMAWTRGAEVALRRIDEERTVRARCDDLAAVAMCGPAHVVLASGPRVLLLDAATGAIEEIGRHEGRVTAVDAMADGRLVAESSLDGTVVLRLRSGQVTRVLRHEQAVDWVSLTADARRAVSGSWDAERSHYRLSLWDTISGSLIRRLEEPAPRRAAFTDDGSHVLSWSADGTLRLWQVARGRCLRTARPLADVVAVHSKDADDVLLATAAELHQLRVLHQAPTAPILVARPRHSDVLEANHASFRQALARATEAIERNELPEAMERLREATAVRGYGRHRDAQAVGLRIARRTARGPLASTYEGRPLHDLGGPVHAVSLDAEGRVATTVVYDEGTGTVEVGRYDTRSAERQSAFAVHEPRGPLDHVAIARDAAVVATSCGGTLRLWRLDAESTTIVPGEHRPTGLSLSSDGRLLLVAADSGVSRWDVARATWLEPLAAPHTLATTCAADADRVVIVTPAGAELWALGAGCRLHPVALPIGTGSFGSGAFDARSASSRSPALARADAPAARAALTADASTALLVSPDGAVALYDVASGSARYAEPSAAVSASALSDEGATLVLGSPDGEVTVRDVRAAPHVVRLGRHTNEVLSVAISGDSLLVASGGRDGDVNLWHLEWQRRPVDPGALGRASSWLDCFLGRAQALAAGRGAESAGAWSASDLDELGRTLARLGYGRHDAASIERALRHRLAFHTTPRRASPVASAPSSGGAMAHASDVAAFDPVSLPMALLHRPHRLGRPVGPARPLPLKLLVVGAFGGRQGPRLVPVRDVDAAMATCEPSVGIRIPGSTTLPAPAVEQRIELRRIADLAPDKLVEQLRDYSRFYFTRIGLDWWARFADSHSAELSPLLGMLRERIARGETARGAATEVCEEHGRGVLAKLIPLDHEGYFVARGTLAGLVHVLVHHGYERVDRAATLFAADVIARGLGELFDSILHDPEFVGLERSWRSVAWLLDALPKGAEVDVHLLDLGHDGLAGALREGIAHRVLESAFERDAPYQAIVMDAPFREPPAGWAALARHAQATVIVGLDSETAAAAQSAPSSQWQAFFRDAASSHVALPVDPVGLRDPYQGLAKMPYVEGRADGIATALLCGSGAYPAALSLVRRFARDGALRIGVPELRSAADVRQGARTLAVTLPLSRLAQLVRLAHLGAKQRAELEPSRAWLRQTLERAVRELSDRSGQELVGTLELSAHDERHWRCDLWLGPRSSPQHSVATSLLLSRG